MRGVRGVGLALVDPRACRCCWRSGCRPPTRRQRRRRVVAQDAVGAGLVLRPRQHHEGWLGGTSSPVSGDAVGADRDQRVVGAQRHEHRAAALDGLVDAVVEELAEEREQRVVRRREADVRRHVRDEQRLVRPGRSRAERGATAAGRTRRRPGCRPVRGRGTAAAATAAGLVDVWSTIRFEIRRGCESKTLPFFCAYETWAQAGPKPGGASSACAEDRGRQARERLVRGRELLAAREQVVARSIDRAQAVGW